MTGRHDYFIDEDWEAEGCAGVLAHLHRRYAERCLGLSQGRNRNVFLFGRYVVKLPKNLDGVADNDWEGSVSNADDDPEEIRYPRTRMVYVHEVPVVFMEYVEPATAKDIEARLGAVPEWVCSVDCHQVGFTRDGRLVAFDYGIR